MTDDPKDDIAAFIEYFKNQISEIGTINTRHAVLYQKLLYASVIDTLAGAVYPKRTNRDRFVSFLQRFCRWPDGDRVSLLHLVQLLRINPDPAFEKLRVWATTNFNSLPVHGPKPTFINCDPSFKEVSSNWPTQKEHRTPLEGIDLTSLQHFQLLYTFRNTLVHELRTLGHGIEFDDDENPFYHESETLDETGKSCGSSVELVYPRKFLHNLCETGLEQLQLYLIANKLNPFDARKFGTYWLSELNR